MDVHETHETIEHSAHGQHSGRNRAIALLIAALAALLAITEMGAKSAQNDYTGHNIEAANVWAFYQAKSIRQTVVRTLADQVEATLASQTDKPAPEPLTTLLSNWKSYADRLESEPSTNEGRRELANRAKDLEHERDRNLSAYHLFELGAGALQISIVLASAAAVTGVLALAFSSAALGSLGFAVSLLGWFAPTLLHL